MSGVFSGQPRVLKGHSQELNHVSSTSSSWTSFFEWHFGHSLGSVRLTITCPQSSQYQTGIRCPHQSWRLMHQSLICSSQLV